MNRNGIEEVVDLASDDDDDEDVFNFIVPGQTERNVRRRLDEWMQQHDDESSDSEPEVTNGASTNANATNANATNADSTNANATNADSANANAYSTNANADSTNANADSTNANAANAGVSAVGNTNATRSTTSNRKVALSSFLNQEKSAIRSDAHAIWTSGDP